MPLDKKLMGNGPGETIAAEDRYYAWQVVKAGALQVLYVAMILGAGVFLIMSMMVTVFLQPFKQVK